MRLLLPVLRLNGVAHEVKPLHVAGGFSRVVDAAPATKPRDESSRQLYGCAPRQAVLALHDSCSLLRSRSGMQHADPPRRASMRQRTRTLFLAVALHGLLPATVRPQASSVADRYVGNWVGVLAMPAGNLRLALAISRDSAVQLTVVMTSLDQGNARIPGQFAMRGDTLIVTMPAVSASYTAILSADSLRGMFTQGINTMPLDMGHAAPRPAVMRPQEPRPPFPYRSHDVRFESVPGVRLAGTVLLPAGNGPFPAVVFVTGSGPQNRNEELLDHKPFLVIADYLARHGIASLRYDDRGTAQSTGVFGASTSADFAQDAEAAVHFLRMESGIARNRIGIVGHSEGGLIAPMVAARSADVAFIVLLAGPGVPGDSILLLQNALIAAASGVRPAMVQRDREVNRRLLDAIKVSRDSADAVVRIGEVSRSMVAARPGDEQALVTRQVGALSAVYLSPWMRYFIPYDPRPALRRVHVPVLALGGTLDLQVPYAENLGAIEGALKAAGNRDYRVVSMPGLNHLFQTAVTGSPAEYSAISETFSPAALAVIGEWINQRFGRAPAK